jgi:hypothetical protein
VHEKVRYHNAYANYRYGKGTLYAAFARSNNSTGNANGRNAATILGNVGNPNNYFAGAAVNAGRYYNIWQLSADYRLSPQFKVGILYGAIHDTTGGNAGARRRRRRPVRPVQAHHAVHLRQLHEEPGQRGIPFQRLGRAVRQPGRQRYQRAFADRLAGRYPAPFLASA